MMEGVGPVPTGRSTIKRPAGRNRPYSTGMKEFQYSIIPSFRHFNIPTLQRPYGKAKIRPVTAAASTAAARRLSGG
jgi:hypothetical protein